MLANKLNYGDTIGVVGVANSLELHNRYEDFYRFVCFGGMMYLLGTEYLPDMKDNILLIESYRTSPNECQRRFAHLKNNMGCLIKSKVLLLVIIMICKKNGDVFPQMEDILLEYTKEYKFPIIKCNDFGHQIANGIIPIGVRCKIDSDNNKIEILDEFLN